MRPAVLALAASALAALACASSEKPTCPGTPVATFRFKGPLVQQGDPDLAGLDPVPALLDCTPDPTDSEAPIRYPYLFPPFDARLAVDPDTGAAALCRSNGIVLSGERTGAASYLLEADADSAFPCNSACGATLRVVVAGDVVFSTGGEPEAFKGILVEVLTEARGACDGCLPTVPGSDPPQRACAARYAIAGRLR